MTVPGTCLHQDRELSKAGCAVSWLLREKKELRHRSWTFVKGGRGRGGVDKETTREEKMVDPNPADSILQVRLQGTAQPRSGVAVPLDPCPCRGGHGGNSGAVVDVCHLATTTLLQRNGSPSFSGVWDPTSRKSPNIPTYLPLRRTLPPTRRDDPPWTAAPLHAPPLHEPAQP